MEGSNKKSKQSNKQGGIRIKCTIETIEYDDDIKEGQCVLEVNDTIKTISTSLDVNLNSKTITLADVDNLIIKVPKSVSPMVNTINSKNTNKVAILEM